MATRVVMLFYSIFPTIIGVLYRNKQKSLIDINMQYDFNSFVMLISDFLSNFAQNFNRDTNLNRNIISFLINYYI